MGESYYIVVELNGQRCFINRDLDYGIDFDEAKRFESKILAEEFLEKRDLPRKSARILVDDNRK